MLPSVSISAARMFAKNGTMKILRVILKVSRNIFNSKRLLNLFKGIKLFPETILGMNKKSNAFFNCRVNFMVRRASLAHYWNGVPNHPEQASESERVEGSSLFE